MLCLLVEKTWEIGFLSSLVFFFFNKERKDRLVVVVLDCGFGKGTVTLDVFGSQETERRKKKKKKRDETFFLNYFFSFFTIRN